MADQFTPESWTAENSAGATVSGAKAYWFVKGTSTPLTVYTDEALSVAHASPQLADSNGVFAPVWIAAGTEAKVDVQDPDTNISLPGYPRDAVPATSAVSTASAIAFTPVAGNSATNVQTAIANNTATLQSKTGDDANLVTGTAGATDRLSKWNADGDLVDAGVSVIDEDDMTSDSATALPTQQSVKAYVDDKTITKTDGSNGYFGVRAYCRVDGTGTPSFERNQGFASITDNGTGDYTVTLSTAMPDTNYLAIVTTNTSGTQFGNAFISSTTEINVTIAGSGGGAIDGRFSLLILD